MAVTEAKMAELLKDYTPLHISLSLRGVTEAKMRRYLKILKQETRMETESSMKESEYMLAMLFISCDNNSNSNSITSTCSRCSSPAREIAGDSGMMISDSR